jgi:hypothetical protein
MDGSTVLGTQNLNGLSKANFFTHTLAVGTHSLTATYNGSAGYAGSTSSAVSQTVNQDGTSLTLSSSANPSVYSQRITLTGTVSALSPGSGTPSGTVTFTDQTTSTVLGTATLSLGRARLLITTLSVGSHVIIASYSGDTNFSTSTSSTYTQNVNKDGTTTSVTSSTNPAVTGQRVTFTATVRPAAPGSGNGATGTVTFMDGGTALGTGTIVSGRALFVTTSLSIGSHAIIAVYNGDSNFNGSTSNPLAETINQGNVTVGLTSSVNPSAAGQTVTFTATVSAASPAAGTPTGTVTFYDGATVLGTATLVGGVATFATSSLVVGFNFISAHYSGDSFFNTGVSGTLSQRVI